ncbi:MAG: hypothetical protein LBK61_04660 [Spirochaetaceae bacterium]|jgi:hypothetical protein|nr:hypothetical protein [Spirochaetaceae bacterium]
MKRRVMVLRAFLLVAVFASFAACNGGTFYDPGQEESGPGLGGETPKNPGQEDSDLTGGGGGNGKPATLSSGASYQEAKAKLDAIIAYCADNPGAANSGVKNGAEAFKSTSFAYITESTWSNNPSTASQAIGVINEFIKNLT